MNHTPGPWIKEGAHIYGANREAIAHFVGVRPLSDMRFCLTVCNAHEEMLAALKGILQLVDDGLLVRDVSRDYERSWAIRAAEIVNKLSMAHAAIAKAEGGEG
jgi:hypothetical protein